MIRAKLTFLFLIVCSLSNAQVTKLNNGTTFTFLEGPVWDGKGALYFSDMHAQKVYKYNPDKGFSVIRDGQVTNGLTFDKSGLMVVCEQGTTNQVVRMDTTGVVKQVIVNTYNNTGFNNPNDLCLDEKGGIYFTDPTWGKMVQDKKAVYYVSPAGKLSRVSDDFNRPNGIALSPDQKLLYVDDTENKHVFVFDVKPDGSAVNKRIFCELRMPQGTTSSGADGLKVDRDGTLYITSTLGVQVFNDAGIWQRTIEVPELPSNVAFGGKDGNTLFITARTGLYSVPLKTAPVKKTAMTSTTFTNPVLNADVPDISVCRAGDDFYMISTTMHLMPGAPIMDGQAPQGSVFNFTLHQPIDS